MSNFDFVPSQFEDLAREAKAAELFLADHPRESFFRARRTLEKWVEWMYRYEGALTKPWRCNLFNMTDTHAFKQIVGAPMFDKIHWLRKRGNDAVHGKAEIPKPMALQAARELHHILFWHVRRYAPELKLPDQIWHDERIPVPSTAGVSVTTTPQSEMKAEVNDEDREAFEQQLTADQADPKMQAIRQTNTANRVAVEAEPDPHDYEAGTREHLIDFDLRRAGWLLKDARDREYPLDGLPTKSGRGRADYVLWGDDGKPLAVVEAKRTTAKVESARQQARQYADALEKRFGQRPIIFFTNGYEIWMWDDLMYPDRKVAGYYTKSELQTLIRRREQRRPLDVAEVNEDIAGRVYQKKAISAVFARFAEHHRKALLVMATGTGKTRTALALIQALQKANWVKNVLFLADRKALVEQASKAVKAHLDKNGVVNLVHEKNGEGRFYVSTYPTILNIINGAEDDRFGVGFFDLVIVDEAHRSVYQKYRAIFEYFDALMLGLTATPVDQIDRNTYDLFGMEDGSPTFAYELEDATREGYLVGMRCKRLDLKFPSQGIQYHQLPDREKEHWESLDWGDQLQEQEDPGRVNAGAVNQWLFNDHTADLVIKHLMEHGHKVQCGDRLAKTIIFARNHDHAEHIRSRFCQHYPSEDQGFVEVIDHVCKNPENLIEKFGKADCYPQIAISVDMLDTGIDVPEVANLVFFKPVYSKVKFWQMIGRGTRLCPDLFGPGQDKENFYIFDCCGNFDFFDYQPEGIKPSTGAVLSTRLFRLRLELLRRFRDKPGLDPEGAVADNHVENLHTRVAAMAPENFQVRQQLRDVHHFQKREHWDRLSESDYHRLEKEVAPLPSRPADDHVEARLFDLLLFRMQIALIDGKTKAFDLMRRQVVDIAAFLQTKNRLPDILAMLDYLVAIQEPEFWNGMTPVRLEELRTRLRGFTHLVKKEERKKVYSNFKDELLEVREENLEVLPRMTGEQYLRKVKAYLKNQEDNIAIYRLRRNQSLTQQDLDNLEQSLTQIGEEDGELLLSQAIEKNGKHGLPWFVRSLVGMDRAAAQDAFARLLNDRSLTNRQIEFIEKIIDLLTKNGIVEGRALYDPPFTAYHHNGPDGLFANDTTKADALFAALKEAHAGLGEGVA